MKNNFSSQEAKIEVQTREKIWVEAGKGGPS